MNIKYIKDIIGYNLSILKKSEYKETALGATLLLFVLFSFLYGIFRIPVIDFGIVRMTPISISDVVYLIVTVSLLGILITLLKYKTDAVSMKAKGSSGFSGFLAGFIAAVCPVCQTLSVAAFGATIASIPTGFLLPYVDLIRLASLVLLSFGLYSVAYSLYVNTCPYCKIDIKSTIKKIKISVQSSDEVFPFLQNKLVVSILAVLAVVVILNQFLATSAFASLVSSSSGGTVSISSSSLKLEYGPKTTLKPMPLAGGEQPVVAGYKTKVKSLPTISELSVSPSTGDLAQDLLNNVIPRGTPWYGTEAGVSFDDPINAQKLWAKGRTIQLDATQDERWKRIVNSFTCDYCCGSPQNPTIITRCGCAHSAAAQGMTKWFIKTYGDKYSDEEIYGEMARWYAVWYPGPTIKRIVQEASL
ncbi:MAG: hypothetical protein HY361_03375 [Candidatus Aenigmarchaeota archaeon]|nr:hypothetical protein [Candidatus Aenigmarchaeota archaeon]